MNEPVSAAAPQATPITPVRPNRWLSLLKFALAATLFWYAQYTYQYYVLIPGELAGSLVRSFGLAGTTLITWSLGTSIVFRFVPRLAVHWRLRRHLGVAGFLFIVFHVGAALRFYFNFDVRAVYYSWNPVVNPIIFGLVAFPILFVMAATSTDWAMRKLKRWWKFIHRFVYLAFLASIFHFILINPSLLKNPAGYLLLVSTALVLAGQLYWFARISARGRFRTLGTVVGVVLIVATVGMAYTVYRARTAPPTGEVVPTGEVPLQQAVVDMREFMRVTPMDIPTSPRLGQAAPEGAEPLRSGEFKNLNYMSSGGVSLLQAGDKAYVVLGDDFSTPPGPDLQVYLTRNSNPTQRHDVAAGLHLGALKSTTGRQVFALPAGTLLSDFNSVTIHCRAFNVPWSYAPFK